MDTNSVNATDTLVKQMEYDLIILKEISKEYNSTPAIYDNSDIRTRLIESFDYKKREFYTDYVAKKSSQLEILNEQLSINFNQYLIDYFGTIERAYSAPSFLDYILTIA